jgi:small subunit ribosomal protein S7e
MFTWRKKIMKAADAEPTELEQQVAQALYDLEVTENELKNDVRDLWITSAKEVETPSKKQALIVFVPYVKLQAFHKIQHLLIMNLEKKFSGKHIVLIGERRILPRQLRTNTKKQQKRPYSRTLTAVHNAILEDICFPTEIVGKRVRVLLDGSRLIKVHLNPADKQSVEDKVETFATVYKKLTGKAVQFEFRA